MMPRLFGSGGVCPALRALLAAALVCGQFGCGGSDSSTPPGQPGSATRQPAGAAAGGGSRATTAAKAGTARKAAGAVCGDGRDQLIRAYAEQSIPIDVTCADFTRTRRTATLS